MCRYGVVLFFCQAEDGIRDLVRSRGLGDVYKRQPFAAGTNLSRFYIDSQRRPPRKIVQGSAFRQFDPCLLYTSDAADERSSVDLGGRRIIKKKKNIHAHATLHITKQAPTYYTYRS